MYAKHRDAKSRSRAAVEARGPILESLGGKRMCKDPSLDVRPRTWATRVTNSSPYSLPFSACNVGSHRSSSHLGPLDSVGPEASTAEGYGLAGWFREGLTQQLLSTRLTPAGPDLQGEEWSGREGSTIPRLLLPFLAASVCL